MATLKNTNRHSCARKTAYAQPKSNRRTVGAVLDGDGAAKPSSVSSTPEISTDSADGGKGSESLAFVTSQPSEYSELTGALCIRVQTDEYRRQLPSWGDIHKGDTLVVQKLLSPVHGDIVLVRENAAQSVTLLECKMPTGGEVAYARWTGETIGNDGFTALGTVVEIIHPTAAGARAAQRQRLRSFHDKAANSQFPPENITAVLRYVSEWPTTAEDNEDGFSAEELWSMQNTQVNKDIARALECEDEGDICEDDVENGFMLFPDSPAYKNLRKRFLEHALQAGAAYSFQFAIWRAYNAGRMSPARLMPQTTKHRDKRRKPNEYPR